MTELALANRLADELGVTVLPVLVGRYKRFDYALNGRTTPASYTLSELLAFLEGLQLGRNSPCG